ncbi:transcription termination factor 2 [Osmerus eperlanus]|uniref:transcription termination factor 2 n=1 Tax=Osmerus eperlanus TaxID=29151 RepID=UPI002E163FFA
MEKVKCTVHNRMCMLKTGVKDGPNKGKSFYMCSERQGTCAFIQEASIPPSHCLNHESSIVDLQTLIPIQQQQCYRLYYRCVEGKTAGQKWCGNIPWTMPEKEKRSPVSDPLLQPPSLAHVRNPFKAPSQPDSTSEWRTLQNGKDQGKGDDRKAEKIRHQRSRDKESEERRGVEGKGRDKESGKSSPSETWRGTQLPAGMKIKKRVSDEEKRARTPPQETAAEVKEHGSNRGDLRGGEEAISSDENQPTNDTHSALDSQDEDSPTIDVLKGTDKHAGKKPCSGERKTVFPDRNATSSKDRHSVGDAENTATPPCDKPFSAQTREDPTRSGRAERSCTPRQSKAESQSDDDDVQFVSVKPGPQQTPPVALVQKTLTSFAGFQSASQVKGQPDDPHALHSQLTAQLKQKKATLSVVNVSALPDKGERLKTQVKDLEDALESLSLVTASQPEPQRGQGEAQPTPAASQSNPFGRKGGTVFLPGGPPPPQHQASGGALGIELNQGHNPHGATPQNQAFYGGRMTDNRLLAVKNATCEAIDHLHSSLESCPGPNAEVPDPRGIKVPLLPHQKRALAWLLWRETQMPGGGILADDMGLGKTLTMIALILAQKKKKKGDEEEETKPDAWLSKNDSTQVVSQGTLIICPASLVHHWKNEVTRHVKSGKLSVCLYHGPNRQRRASVLAEHDIVVTTYSLVSKEIPVQKEDAEKPSADADHVHSDHAPLMRVSWARVVLDEAHNIKNPKVQTSLAVCKLRARARWAVTGTPIQNNLLDMYSLLKFLRCSPFDEFKLWKAQVDNGSKRGGERLNLLTRALLLRRTKDQRDTAGKPLVSLPDRTCQVHRLKLSEEEQSVYDVVFARSRSTLQNYLKRHEGGEVKKGSNSNPFNKVAQEFGLSQTEPLSSQQPQASSTVHILSLLLRLRQCCCHLSLLKKTLDQTELQGDGVSLSLEEQLSALCLAEPSPHDPEDTVSLNGSRFASRLFEDTTESTKISAILTELNDIRRRSDDQKSVIVSQWTSMLHIVAVHLRAMGLRFAVIDGTVNPKRRMDLVEEFNTNPKGAQVMLVSLCAGGVGINLIGGNHLFLMDMHWNPALEDQACDRIYRVGQHRDVTIHRFVCEGTVEDKISTLQEKKKELAQKVLSGTGGSFTKLSLADLRVIFGV